MPGPPTHLYALLSPARCGLRSGLPGKGVLTFPGQPGSPGRTWSRVRGAGSAQPPRGTGCGQGHLSNKLGGGRPEDPGPRSPPIPTFGSKLAALGETAGQGLREKLEVRGGSYKGPRWPSTISSEPPPRNKGFLFRAGRARPRPDWEEEKLFPGCGSRKGAGEGPAAGRARSYLPPDPPARRGPRGALTSSMAATVFRHCAVRVVKLEAVGAL